MLMDFGATKQAWALGIAACLAGALIGAASTLGAEAYAAKVQRSLSTSIEQYQALQGGNQVWCQAGTQCLNLCGPHVHKLQPCLSTPLMHEHRLILLTGSQQGRAIDNAIST